MGNQKITLEKGFSSPLGTSRSSGGVNFALFAENATKVDLLLFVQYEANPFAEVSLNRDTEKNKNLWHVLVKGLPDRVEYAYRIDGPFTPEKGLRYNSKALLSDPYSLALSSSNRWGDGCPAPARSRLIGDVHFDWQGVAPPRIPFEDLVIYEMHVRAFTCHASSQVAHPGTYLGVLEKIPHLKELGVNAIELLPIHEFNECEIDRQDPRTHKRLYNFWGYSTINFFAPMNRYATSSRWAEAIIEFKTMVRELHRHGIEVILDVVYNHTAEGNEKGPYLSFRGIDNPNYYMMTPDGHYQNFTGCGNTFNCNKPVDQQLIVDSLRYWVNEMKVDGFRFDLASILTRDPTGAPMGAPPVIHAINRDPVLSETKLIAEAWDAAGLYQVGSFPGEGRWAEWNGVYRDVVRRFIKGTDGQAGSFATALSGSQNIYGHDRQPYHSVNFVIAHDGFTLKDLVSYNTKHNESNAENNCDGADQNDSWNCGEEGPSGNHYIMQLRERQMRNFQLALLLSLGTPMLFMGDEYGHTRHGNNNGWSHDDALNWFQWDLLKKERGFFRFYKELIHFRKRHPILQRSDYYTTDDIEWHGHAPHAPNWDASSRFVAFTLKDARRRQYIYVAFNAHFDNAHVKLPPPPSGRHWFKVIDTAAHAPDDFLEDPKAHHALRYTFDMIPYSAFVAVAL